MNAIGVVAIIGMPFAIGCIGRAIIGKKEINLVETYLVGFFFILFLQGLIFNLGQQLEMEYISTGNILLWVLIILGAIGLILLLIEGIRFFQSKNNKKSEAVEKQPLSTTEQILMGIAVIQGLFIIIRLIKLLDYVRLDDVISSVIISARTETVFQYNPLTNQAYELGLITSRKIITLSAFYGYITKITGLNERLFLYLIVSFMTIVLSYFAIYLVLAPMLHQRRRIIIFTVFFQALILSGDYYSGAIGYKLLQEGYSGEAMIVGILMPYLMYIAMDWYRHEKEGCDFVYRLESLFKIILVLLSSIFIIPASSGVILLILEIALLSSIIIYRLSKEVEG